VRPVRGQDQRHRGEYQARIGSEAGPGEILASRTVVDLVAGSDIEFADRGMHALKGVPGEWQLFAVVS
jgi:class 3 adenylate cyclase